MGKLLCRCKTVLRLSGPIPNPIEWRLLSDETFDQFSGMVDAEAVYRGAISAFRCATCDRLWVFWDGFDKEPACYAVERPAT
jgi:hypothetical protein